MTYWDLGWHILIGFSKRALPEQDFEPLTKKKYLQSFSRCQEKSVGMPNKKRGWYCHELEPLSPARSPKEEISSGSPPVPSDMDQPWHEVAASDVPSKAC